MENLINIGIIVGTHHLRGSVKINSIFENIEIIENERVLLEKNENGIVKITEKPKIENTSGCGDSAMSGIIFGVVNEKDILEIMCICAMMAIMPELVQQIKLTLFLMKFQLNLI